jgi:hypothetical protein
MVNIRRHIFFTAITAVMTAFLLAGCGGFFPSSNTITALSISPTGAWIKPGNTQQFTATATFGNNTTGDVTSQVTWISSSTGVATIVSSGLATAVAVGNVTITAKSNNGSVSATAPMTVSTRTITSITLNPNNPSISLSQGEGLQFTANATLSDGTVQDITGTASWTSGSPSVASITSGGFASPIAMGTTTITASDGGMVGTTQLTVQ